MMKAKLTVLWVLVFLVSLTFIRRLFGPGC